MHVRHSLQYSLYIGNKSGPKTEPCGTPLQTDTDCDCLNPISEVVDKPAHRVLRPPYNDHQLVCYGYQYQMPQRDQWTETKNKFKKDDIISALIYSFCFIKILFYIFIFFIKCRNFFRSLITVWEASRIKSTHIWSSESRYAFDWVKNIYI